MVKFYWVMKSLLIHAAFWMLTGEKLDKDRFRRDLGNIEEAYKAMLFRLTGERA